MRKLENGFGVLIAGLALFGAAQAFAAPAQVAAGSSNLDRCVAQKQQVAKTYCQNAGKDCSTELAAARKECRREVRLGLHFQSS